MNPPKFSVGKKVKFVKDHDRMAGEVLSFTYSSDKGYVYTVSSKAYDFDKNEMIDGVMICQENELIEVQ